MNNAKLNTKVIRQSMPELNYIYSLKGMRKYSF